LAKPEFVRDDDGAAATMLIRVPPTSAAATRPPAMPRVLRFFIGQVLS
jgi:hypothetical protein